MTTEMHVSMSAFQKVNGECVALRGHVLTLEAANRSLERRLTILEADYERVKQGRYTKADFAPDVPDVLAANIRTYHAHGMSAEQIADIFPKIGLTGVLAIVADQGAAS